MFCATLFVFLVSLKYFSIQIVKSVSVYPVHIQSMNLALSTLQVQRHEYSRDLNIVIYACSCTLSFMLLTRVCFHIYSICFYTIHVVVVEPSYVFGHWLAFCVVFDRLFLFFCGCFGTSCAEATAVSVLI